MITVRLSTEFSTAFKVGTKKYVAFLRRPDLIEVYGSDIKPEFPMCLQFINDENECEWDFSEEYFKSEVKYYKKNLKAMNKK
jgi:hypothetical protein